MTEEEFLLIVDSLPIDPGTQCKLWTGEKVGKGYAGCGGKVRGNRVVLARKLGRKIKPGYMALHTCDIRHCVNEDHLYEGTHQDNMDDMVRRGRSLTGRKNPMNLYPEKRTKGDKHWTHHRVHPLLGQKMKEHQIRRGVKHHFAKTTVDQVLEIRRLSETGLSNRQISDKVGIPICRIYHIVTRRHWRHV